MSDAKDNTPKSMVFRIRSSTRDMSSSVTQLVQDFRGIMNPYTAIRLRERRANALKDFVVMSGPLGVTHLCVFTQSEQANTMLRIARTPHGPTLNFLVKSYSLCKDIASTQKNPRAQNQMGPEYMQPPLLVMNGFSTEQKSDKDTLVTSMLQNMFPPIQVQSTRVSSIRRVLLLNQDPATGQIELRHYAIESRLVNLSKPMKKLARVERNLHKKMPNMSNAADIAEYLLDPAAAGGFTSESEIDEDATVEVERSILERSRTRPRRQNKATGANAQDITGDNDNDDENDQNGTNNNDNNNLSIPTRQKRAIKLTEIGPRMTLELRKIEAGLCDGKILYHSQVSKSKKEAESLETVHKERQSLKEKRRKEQELNVRKKQELRKEKKTRSQRGLERAQAKEAAANGSQEIKDFASFSSEDEKDPEEMDDYELEAAAMAGDSDEDLF